MSTQVDDVASAVQDENNPHVVNGERGVGKQQKRRFVVQLSPIKADQETEHGSDATPSLGSKRRASKSASEINPNQSKKSRHYSSPVFAAPTKEELLTKRRQVHGRINERVNWCKQNSTGMMRQAKSTAAPPSEGRNTAFLIDISKSTPVKASHFSTLDRINAPAPEEPQQPPSISETRSDDTSPVTSESSGRSGGSVYKTPKAPPRRAARMTPQRRSTRKAAQIARESIKKQSKPKTPVSTPTSTPRGTTHKVNSVELKERQKKRIQEKRDLALQEQSNRDLRDACREDVLKRINRRIRNKDAALILREFFPQSSLPHRPSSAVLKKAYRNALAYYHPDRAHSKSVEEQVETEEIYKVLTGLREKLV